MNYQGQGVSPSRLTFTKTLDMLLTTDYFPNDDALVLVPFEYDHFSKSWNQMTQGIPPTAMPHGWSGTDNWKMVQINIDANGDPGLPFIPAGPNEWLYFSNLGTEAEAIFKLERI